MTTFYKQLPFNKKISLTHSMRFLTQDFIKNYNWDSVDKTKSKDLFDELYFYWLRNSAEKKYLWCEDSDADVFSDSFTLEMKTSLRLVWFRLNLESQGNKFNFNKVG
jgi:hypothetical protein